MINIAAGAEKIIGPFINLQFNDTNGKVNIDYDSVTSVTVAAIKL